MARCPVEHVRCDRCKRVELMPPQPDKTLADFEARFIGPDGKTRTLKYSDLCTSCKKSIENTWTHNIVEWKRELTQQFGPKVNNNGAAPLTPQPDYSPPKPHSLAASKK